MGKHSIEHSNELVVKKGFDNAEAYTNFGLHHLHRVNTLAEKWLQGQTFAHRSPDPSYGKMIVKGDYNDSWTDSQGCKEYPDKVEWDLRFRDSLKRPIISSGVFGAVGDALLHIKRLPEVGRYNSAPDMSTSINSIDVRVGNGTRGWVDSGEFPVNTYVSERMVETDKNRLGYEKVNVAVHADPKFNAEEGFRAALEWAKFRTMALACSEYLYSKLREEADGMKRNFHDGQRFRDMTSHAVPLAFEFLPDTRVSKGPTALRPYYYPGFLEAAVALELEKGIAANFGRRRDAAPLYSVSGSPIQLFPSPGKSESYDAILPFRVRISGPLEDKAIVGFMQEELGNYFDVTVRSPAELNFRLHIPEAHKVVDAIYEKHETPMNIQRQVGGLIEALGVISEKSSSWEGEHMPVLEAAHVAAIEGGKAQHFNLLGMEIIQGRNMRLLKRERDSKRE